MNSCMGASKVAVSFAVSKCIFFTVHSAIASMLHAIYNRLHVLYILLQICEMGAGKKLVSLAISQGIVMEKSRKVDLHFGYKS